MFFFNIFTKVLAIISFLVSDMIPAGFEPATVRLEGECSIQLSYGTSLNLYILP